MARLVATHEAHALPLELMNVHFPATPEVQESFPIVLARPPSVVSHVVDRPSTDQGDDHVEADHDDTDRRQEDPV